MTATQMSIKDLHRSISKSYNLLINHSIECLNFNQMLITLSGLLIGFTVVFGSAAPLFADYTLILKNGRTVNVEAYKEEGDMIIFSSYGGEIRIAKDDVQSIIPAVEGLATRQVPPQTDVVPGEPPELGPGEEKLARPGQQQGMEGMKDGPLATNEKILTPEEIRAEKRAKEEKEYQKRVREITERLKATRVRFAVATKRATGPDPTKLCVFNCGKVIKAKVTDLNSRSKDAEHNPATSRGTGIVNLETNSPFAGQRRIIGLRHGGKIVPGSVTGQKLDFARPGRTDFPKRVSHHKQTVDTPLPTYSNREKKLSQLKGRILALEKQRDRLIQEMRDRNFNTASLFLQ